MSTRKPTRRQLLRGAGGFTLALPFLPSLVDPREARSASAAPAKRFVQFCTDHGAIWGPNMYPADATLTDSLPYAGWNVKRGKLALQPGAGGTAQLSPVLRGPSTLLTPALVAKMNVLRGCDIPFYIAHNTGGHLGNFARNDGGGDGDFMKAYPTPTIDQIMAWSPKFYSDLASIRQRVIVTGPRISYNWSNPSMPKNLGPVQEVVGTRDAVSLFKQIFVSSGSGVANPNSMLVPLVDRVQADYKRLRNANTRLSGDDRHRLDDHMQRMSELQRRLNVHASCPSLPPVTTNTIQLQNAPAYPVDPSLQAQLYQAMNDVIVAAILCDTSRIAVVHIAEDFSTYAGDWHADIAHHAIELDGVKEQLMLAAHQLTFEKVFLDLCAKLDVDEGNGKTYLDNSLVAWTQEAGEYTHYAIGIPIITAGGAGGFFNTGNYCDYRNPANWLNAGQNVPNKTFSGLLWQQWLGTALQSMGLQRADYETNGLGGYPTPIKFMGPDYVKWYPDAIWNVAGEVLPFIKA
jgi:hypothetical protein